jgi:hypothetical protein
MLYHYGDTIILDVNNNITYNGRNNLLNDNLGMSYVEIKETICHGLEWSYNDIDVEITWRCQISEHQYYPVLIVCDYNFKTIIDSSIESGLNMMIFYVSSQPKYVCPNFHQSFKVS